MKRLRGLMSHYMPSVFLQLGEERAEGSALVWFLHTVLKLMQLKANLGKRMIHVMAFRSGLSQLMVSKEKKMILSYYQQLDPMVGVLLDFLLISKEQMLLLLEQGVHQFTI